MSFEENDEHRAAFAYFNANDAVAISIDPIQGSVRHITQKLNRGLSLRSAIHREQSLRVDQRLLLEVLDIDEALAGQAALC